MRLDVKAAATVILAMMLLALGAAPAAAQDGVLIGIQGADDRRPIDSADWPWAAIGRLNRATGGFCTATLIAARVVLTAAHCVYDSRLGRWSVPEDLHFTAGYRRGAFLAHAMGSRVVRAPDARPDLDPNEARIADDWALIVLDRDIDIRPVPWRALAPSALAAALAEGVLLRAGYSQDRPHLLAVHAGCVVEGFTAHERLFVHSCDATHGDSGSALLLRTGDDTVVLGLHVAVSTDGVQVRGIAIPAPRFDAAAGSLAGRSPAGD